MRICLLTSTFLPLVGGLEVVVHNLATALTELGHQVFLVTPYHHNRKVIDNYGYRVIRFGFKGYGKLKLSSVCAIMTLNYVVKRYKIDVINVHNVYKPASWAYYFSRYNRRVPIVGTPHGDDIQVTPEIGFGARLDPKSDAIIRRNLRSFTRITSISPSIRKDLCEIVENRAKIVDIPNGVWVKHLQKKIHRTEVRKKFGIPKDSIAVISIGRNHVVKGFEFGLDAVAKLRKSNLNISYILVGRDMAPIINKAQLLSVSNSLIIPGEVDAETVSQLLKASDIYISPSIIESFGLSMLEAMSAGLPCIVTDIPGRRELAFPNCVLLVKPKDSEQISDGIKYLIDNPSVRQQMAENASAAAAKYDWLNIASMYIDVYRNAIKSKRRQIGSIE